MKEKVYRTSSNDQKYGNKVAVILAHEVNIGPKITFI